VQPLAPEELMRGFFVLVSIGVMAAACTSSDDSGATRTSTSSLVGAPGEDSIHGGMPCHCDHDDYVCPRARRGFGISPVPIDPRGRSCAEIVQVSYGSYLVNAAADCAGCHSSPAGFLAGGTPFALDHAGHVVFSRNLTPDHRTGMQLTRRQFVEALRTGRDFHPGSAGMLTVMPWLFYRWASDGDLRAIYAYLRAIPPARNAVPPDRKAGLGLPPAIRFTGVYDEGDVPRVLPPDDGSLMPNLRRGRAIQPLAEPRDLGHRTRFERGSYLANSLSTCGECHTQGVPGAPLGRDRHLRLVTEHYLTGGNVFIAPPALRPVIHQNREMAANLRGAEFGFFHEPDVDYPLFAEIIRTESHADENPPRPLGFAMPASSFRKLVDDDLRAIFTYMRHVTPAHTSDLPRQDYARWCAADADCESGEACHIDPNPTFGNECVGRACRADADCDTCQTCDAGACVAPAPHSACVLSGG
jgi:mono/diheme cytochrome c family protein